MQLPQSNILTTKYLNRVFDKTVATYKYYWFLGILDLCVKHGKTRMNVWEIMIMMVANAWYPVVYFRLSFGKSESLYEAIWALQKEYNIPINISIRDLTNLLHELIQSINVRRQLNFLQMNVPFRFLRPWIDTSDDRQTVVRSQSFENGCIYKLEKQNGTLWIEMNPAWLDYLKENYKDKLKVKSGTASTLSVRVIMEKMGTKKIDIPLSAITIKGRPTDLDMVLTPADKITVEVAAVDGSLDNIDQNDVKAVLDLTSYQKEGRHEVPVQITLPDGYELTSEVKIVVNLTKKQKTSGSNTVISAAEE